MFLEQSVSDTLVVGVVLSRLVAVLLPPVAVCCTAIEHQRQTTTTTQHNILKMHYYCFTFLV